MSTSKTIFVGLGGNRPSTDSALRRAHQTLVDRFHDVYVSSLLTTEPHETEAQGPFLNQVVQFHTPSPDPNDLLQFLLALEKKIGRQRDGNPNRLIDLDLLYVGRNVVRKPNLRVPHPRIHRRPFVLQSMVELAPHFAHPILRKTQRQLLNQLSE